MKNFQELPSEIHVAVCDAARWEDRRSLVLVNRYLQEIVTPLLYKLVFLPTRRRVISFQRTLSQNPFLAVHVRHLLMSDRDREGFHIVLPDFVIYQPQTHTERAVRRQRIYEWLVEREKELLLFRSSLRHILTLVSPQLLSLTLLHYEYSIKTLSDLLMLPFPVLEELTIRGDYPILPKNLYLPRLTRLHLAAGDMPNPWASFSALAKGCPNLTHLRITEPLSCILSGVMLAEALEVAHGLNEYDAEALAMPIGRRPDGTTWIPPPPSLPNTLQSLLLQPYPPEMSVIGMHYQDHTDMMDRLEALEQKVRHLKLIPVNNEHYVLPYSFDAAYRDWKDRMDGGGGCWIDYKS